MGQYATYARLGTEAQAALEAWNQALADRADHELDCERGCTFLGGRCETGQALADRDMALHAAWVQARSAQVTL